MVDLLGGLGILCPMPIADVVLPGDGPETDPDGESPRTSFRAASSICMPYVAFKCIACIASCEIPPSVLCPPVNEDDDETGRPWLLESLEMISAESRIAPYDRKSYRK